MAVTIWRGGPFFYCVVVVNLTRLGVGACGGDLNECLGGLSSYGNEEISAAGFRCLSTNRMAYRLSALKIWTYSNGM